MTYDALLIVSFGGPERNEDVMPFLQNVLRGKNVPQERMLEVAEHYYQFGGVSPINEQNRALIAALRAELDAHGPKLPIYWGNRNWHPLLRDTLSAMRDDGVRNALGFFTSAYSSYSGCRQYRENIEQAHAEVGPAAPRVDKLRVFFNHPEFISAMIERVQEALARIPAERHAQTQLVYTAHSIPQGMSQNCRYVDQLQDACRLASAGVGPQAWQLVYQSRSGPPSQPWLEPDVNDCLRELAATGVRDVVIVPIGFVSDHLEIIFDLDTQAQQLCVELGINMIRAATVGTHPRFIRMIRELILERTADAPRRSLGELGPSHDVCPVDCCLPPARPSR
jgi:ferrochelatase